MERNGDYWKLLISYRSWARLAPTLTHITTHDPMISGAEDDAMSGALNWAALAMCPNIAFAVATVARFTTKPGPAHWEAVKHIYHYLAGMCDLWLLYSKARRTLEGYADADSSMSEDQHAISGYTFLIDGGAVSWSSKRQDCVVVHY